MGADSRRGVACEPGKLPPRAAAARSSTCSAPSGGSRRADLVWGRARRGLPPSPATGWSTSLPPGARWRGARRARTTSAYISEMASLAPRSLGLLEIALPYMEDLYEATHENVQLAVRDGLELVFVERLAGRDAVRVLTRVGGRFALHATGVGLVLLAYAPPTFRSRCSPAPWSAGRPKTIGRPGPAAPDPRRGTPARLRRQRRPGHYRCPVRRGAIRASGQQVVAALSLVVAPAGPSRASWRRRAGPRDAGSPCARLTRRAAAHRQAVSRDQAVMSRAGR